MIRVNEYTIGFTYLKGRKPLTKEAASEIRHSLKRQIIKGYFPEQPPKGSQPFATACFIKKGEQLIGVGTSVCAEGDQYLTIRGRGLSFSRALAEAPSQDRDLIKAAYNSWQKGRGRQVQPQGQDQHLQRVQPVQPAQQVQ